MGYESFEVEEKSGVALIALKKRVVGVKDAALLSAELSECCQRLRENAETRVLVVTGERKDAFSMGGAGVSTGKKRELFPSIVGSFAAVEMPVLAGIWGDATGLGLELALACDIRVGTEGGRFGLPQIRQGSIPFCGGTQRLPRLVGQGRALEMILTGELIDAAEAHRIGLIHRVVSPKELMSTTMALARDMASKSPLAMSYAREALYQGMDLTLDQGLRMELDLYLLLFTTQDRVEGINAFREKRAPAFKGI